MSVATKQVIAPSPEARADYKRTPIVRERFELRPASVERVRSAPWSFGFGAFSDVVYHDNYARKMSDGRLEAWPDTILRVVNGNVTIRKDWMSKHGLRWDEERWQETAEEMALAFLRLRCGPPGRGYFASGTDFVYERGSMALYNCSASKVLPESFDRDLGWIADALLHGSGVGIECVSRPYKMRSPEGEPAVYVVPDTKEGWSESVEVLARSYMHGTAPVAFDYSEIRPEGATIKSFGGVCPGSEPLKKLHVRLRTTFDRYVRGEISPTRLVADVANMIGCCVVAGGVRRSAEVLIGDPDDREFWDLKNYERFPEREEWGWVSNNSVRLSETRHFQLIPEIAPRIRRNGEPGIYNLISTRRFGRFGREMPDDADLANPCQPAWATLLTPLGITTMGQVGVGDTIWSGKRWTKITRKVSTGIKPVYGYKTRAGTFYGTENHHVVQNGVRVEAKDAETIDVAPCLDREEAIGSFDPVDVMDGLMLGDGSVHKASNNLVFLLVGKDDKDYFKSEVASLFVEDRSASFTGKREMQAWIVKTTIFASELPKTYERRVPDRFVAGLARNVRGFLRGLFSANGSAVGGNRVTLKASSFAVIETVQAMLSSLGIRSYHTVNKAHDVEFENGTYTCRESYDVNIGPDRGRFQNLIGFLQGYKNEKLNATLVGYEPSSGRHKASYEVVEKHFLGDEEVYDITVEAEEHTYWTGGLLVSNCLEIPLCNKEVCCLAETYPSRCETDAEVVRSMELATIYASNVILLPTHSPETNEVIARNRRIGVSLSGVSDWEARTTVAEMTCILRRGYKAVVAQNQLLAKEAGVRPSIRHTTVKPSGTVSLLAGVSPGGHFALAEYYIRRKRVSVSSPLRPLLEAAGYPFEKDVASDQTLVFEFPMAQPGVRIEKDAGMWEQALKVCELQREWSDNSVSYTVTFDRRTEGAQLGNMLAQIAPMVKTVSCLPRQTAEESDYEQLPVEAISKREYLLRVKMVRPIDWAAFRGEGTGEADKYCNTSVCEVPKR